MRLFLIAGEPSGDALGGALMDGLRTLLPDVAFAGVGGPSMQAAGLQSLFPMADLSVMGLAEVLPKYRHLKRRIRETAEAIARTAPDAVVTIDSPDFCLRVLALARAENPGLKTIHYVAPSVWAWRAGRARKMARVVDHVLALLPFEPPYMTAAGMSCDFVGHPVVAQPQASADEAMLFRAGAQVSSDAPLILCLPGSRRGEVSRLLPIFRAALTRVVAAHPGARIVIPTTPNVTGLVRSLTEGWAGVLVLDPTQAPADAYARQKRAAFRAADVALAASGTVSLELAAAGTPMVIAYRMNALSQAIITRLLRVDTVTLVNLVSETRTVPEFIGRDCRPDPIAAAVDSILGAGRPAQIAAMDLTMERLGRGGEAPGLRAARSVLAAIGAD
ncbi:MAG: lipid-A-disaccharide synthase [Rhodobacteraceae bacterium]|nr:lipid-A-disaccharide synthase [Paracoccaceae bacterium]